MRSDFSEAKLIFGVAHEVLLCGLVVIPMLLTLASDNPVLRYILSGIGIFIATSTTIFIIVGAKIWVMYFRSTQIGSASSMNLTQGSTHGGTSGRTQSQATQDDKYVT